MMERVPREYLLRVDRLIQGAVDFLVNEWRPAFQAMRYPIGRMLDGVSGVLEAMPFWVVVVLFALAGWRMAGWRHGLFCAVSFALIAFMGLWDEAMTSLAILVTAVSFCIVIGVPLGIVAGRSDRFWSLLQPLLDVMQTTPSFVYLVPVVMLFGIGTVPGVIATIIFAMPPIIRLTNHGLRQVPADTLEAGEAFGATEWQSLVNIRLPLALPSIMVGLNQTLLMALVMSVVIAMIGAEGLGLTVLRGIGALDVGLAGIGGLAIVLLAISLDRITQGFVRLTTPSGQRSRFKSMITRFRTEGAPAQ
ncbi:MAG: glycine/betaine transporter permease [Enterovirga sp.]|jgi:glycine betaine/proline transport system permease protein|nr:glycine/betaine transporter permease [Enterovirga sp.]